MGRKLLLRRFVSAGLMFALAATTAFASSAEQTFYRAYYLERETGDIEAAARLYAEVVGAANVDPAIKTRAEARLAVCREGVASRDLIRLMPPGAMVYVELNRPGDQLNRLIDMLGLLASPTVPGEPAKTGAVRLAISPHLADALLGFRGAAVALTGFDLVKQMPAGVAVLHPGDMDVIRGLIETALPVVAEPSDPIEGYPAYQVEGKAYVCLTARLIVVSPQKSEIASVVRRMQGKTDKSLATNKAMAEALSHRGDAVLFFCVNAKPIVPMVIAMSGASRDLAMAQAMLDLNSLRWLAGRVGVDEDGLVMDVAIRFESGQKNLAYNLFRTPPITGETLMCIPNGAAGFLAGALGGEGSPTGAAATDAGEAPPAIIGLDFGREIFANIVDFAVYVLPPKEGAGATPGPAPDAAAVIRVNDPSKSEALWTQMLGIASLAAGAPTTNGTMERIGEVEVRTYKFPEGVTVYFGTVGDKILVSTSLYAMQRAVATAGGGESILTDEAFAPSLARLDEKTSKALFLHPGRCLQVARKYMSEHEIREAAPFAELLDTTVASVVTNESPEKFHLSATVTGLPKMGGFVAQMIQRERRQEQMRGDLSKAMRAKQWDKALQTVDALLAETPERANLIATKFKILAQGTKDHEAAKACAKRFMEKAAGSPTALNNFAWALLTEEAYEERYNDIALELAERACKLTRHGRWRFVDTLALAKFKTGDLKAAIELQKKAIALDKRGNRALKEALARYEAALNRRTVEATK